MQTYYNGAHNITFVTSDGETSISTWNTDDASNSLFLVPRSKPMVNPPAVKTNTIEIPGANGDIDMTDIPLGYPVYGKRTGSWEFIHAEDISNRSWDEEYARIMAALHGKRLMAILGDDPTHFYIGRFSVNAFKGEDNWDTVTIDYDLDSFKYNIWTTVEDWFWDPFDFWYGTIETREMFVDIPLNYGNQTIITYTQALIGNAPVTPTFTINTPGYDPENPDETGGATLAIHNLGTPTAVKTFELPEGTSTNPLIEMIAPNQNDNVRLVFYNTKNSGATASVAIRPGRL